MKKTVTLSGIFLFLYFAMSSNLTAQVSIAEINTAVAENFDSLAATGSDLIFTDNITLAGWYTTRGFYSAGSGTATGGTNYSFGTSSSSSERALGSVVTAGSGIIRYGIRLKNNTGMMISSLDIEYTGEQWRNGGNTTAQALSFEYRQAAEVTDLTTGTYTAVPALNFTSLINTSTGSSLNGNLSANRTMRTASVSVNVPFGEEIMLRWTDIDNSGTDHGLAIDDLIITPRATPTAAGVEVSGRVRTASGRGIRNARILVEGGDLAWPIIVMTNSFGYYRVEGLAAGQSYIVTVESKRFGFASPVRVVNAGDGVAGLDFVSVP